MGKRMATPGSRMRLNLPIRSTIQAVCWGTKRMMVLAGREGRWKYEDGAAEVLAAEARAEAKGAEEAFLLESGCCACLLGSTVL